VSLAGEHLFSKREAAMAPRLRFNHFSSWSTFFSELITGLFLLLSCDSVLGPSIESKFQNKILFTSSRSGIPQLYVIDPDGSGLEQITSGPHSHSGGRWSPDHTKIVANTNEMSNTAGDQMVVIDLRNGIHTLLGIGFNMSWTRDGGTILFSYWPGADVGVFNAAIYAISPQGTNRRMIRDSLASVIDFSPDGTRLVMLTSENPALDVPPLITIVTYPDLDDWNRIGAYYSYSPRWSPSGSEIVYSGQAFPDSAADIRVMNDDGLNIRTLVSHHSIVSHLAPHWSPDGRWIAYIEGEYDSSTTQFYLSIVNIDGTNPRRLLADPTIQSCDWSW